MDGKDAFWGQLVRDLRTEQGMSQRQLAEEANVHRATLRRMENGATDGHVCDLERLLAVLGYELDAHGVDGTVYRRPQPPNDKFLLLGLT